MPYPNHATIQSVLMSILFSNKIKRNASAKLNSELFFIYKHTTSILFNFDKKSIAEKQKLRLADCLCSLDIQVGRLSIDFPSVFFQNLIGS
jgi:hypothetical protein